MVAEMQPPLDMNTKPVLRLFRLRIYSLWWKTPRRPRPKEPPFRLTDSEDLTGAAQQLVNAAVDHGLEKFRNSNIMDLMRRIANQEVVIQDRCDTRLQQILKCIIPGNTAGST
ncbi:hypothetical protein TruAng_010335 [Truncatella angustata]|nr:hypothetical protein TruAng_010335 [Truncatella angustata]